MTTSRDFVLAFCYFPRVLETPTIVSTLRGRGPLISRVFTFFVIILLFCIRASTRQNETTRHFDTMEI